MALQAKGKAARHLFDILRSTQKTVYSLQYAEATVFLSKFTERLPVLRVWCSGIFLEP